MMHRYYLLIVVLFLSSCSNFLFVPTRAFPVTPDAAEIVYQEIFFESFDNTQLHGWKLNAEGEKKGSILFLTGNGDNVSTQLPNTFWLAKQGYDLYVFDYRGYGMSSGTAELDTTIKDVERIIAYVVGQLPEDEKLIVIGHSLGGAMAIYTVAHSDYKEQVKALITIEAFSDYHDVTQDVLSKSWLFWLFQWPLSFTIDNSYRPLDSVALISPIPLAIIHSKSDKMIAMYHAERLFAAAKQPKTFLLINSNHSNVFISKENRQVLFDYLKTLE